MEVQHPPNPYTLPACYLCCLHILLTSFTLQRNSNTGTVAAHGASGGIHQQAALRKWLLDIYRTRQQLVTQAGLDSLGAVEFRNAVSGAFAMDVPATAAFDYPTIAALAAYISSKAIVRIYFSSKDQPFLRLASCHAWHPACIRKSSDTDTDSVEKSWCKLRRLLKHSLLACFCKFADGYPAWSRHVQGNWIARSVS